ncbi:TIGR04283 family arsenosugar biosynthesis glycosyltransferase [Novispirillum sp. DQ9]|uniref:TIGR04283 family arsenosugar biosynthesis glycosyltransferase n=1 Tax=Novispirillum sp. DQ9 TaxID=3398612 RepID=UPI003C7D4ACC
MPPTAVIPTLNAAATLPACFAALGDGWRVVVADGGSDDGTAEVAAALGARVVAAPRGRGPQIKAGAEAALAEGADWLLLLHADTVLGDGWRQAAEAHMATSGKAAFFRLAFDDASAGARRVAALANWRARALGLPYGDQGLLLPAALYRAVGGVRPLPLMEDVDLARRLGRGRLVALEADAVTSAARYRRDGWWARPARNLALLSLFLLGVPPHRLVRAYERGRR